MKKKVETTYICELCGEEFDEEDMCREHEENEKLLLECCFWDSSYKKRSFDYWQTSPEEIFYMYIPTSNHLDAVNEWFSAFGLETVSTNNQTTAGIFFYRDSWKHLGDRIGELRVLEARLLEEAKED